LSRTRVRSTQGQQAVFAGAEILDQRLGAERGRRRRRADFAAFQHQADAEAFAIETAIAHQIEITRLEHAQTQRGAGNQHGLQRKQAERLRVGHDGM
jgi:hypothetical protein